MKKIILVSFFICFFVSCTPNNNAKYVAINKDVFKKFEKQELAIKTTEDFVLVEGNKLDASDLEHLSELAHKQKKCGGFTQIEEGELTAILENLKKQKTQLNLFQFDSPEFKQEVQSLVDQLSKDNLKKHILFLQEQGTRSAYTPNPNVPINRFHDEIRSVLSSSKLEYELEKVSHSRITQKSLRVRLTGSKNPEQIVILGGHIDSTGGLFRREAPGADDNASGSAAILEVLRVLSHSSYKPKKTIEFMWYAGEEQGLIGSKEIAQQYKNENKNVTAVMQLDMILFPGNNGKMGIVSDYTDSSLNTYIEELIKLYVKVPTEKFDCGYACSDHASWHQQGYPAVAPFEATVSTLNNNIHTARDVFDENSDLDHALKFTKLAAAYVFELGEWSYQ